VYAHITALHTGMWEGVGIFLDPFLTKLSSSITIPFRREPSYIPLFFLPFLTLIFNVSFSFFPPHLNFICRHRKVSGTRAKSSKETEGTIHTWYRVVLKEGPKKKTRIRQNGHQKKGKMANGGQKSFFSPSSRKPKGNRPTLSSR